jgi:hypothetical protein
MKTLLLTTAMSVALMGSAFAGFQGNAAPPPICYINDRINPPANVRTRPNGVIITTLPNGERVGVIDQIRDYDGLWDFVMNAGEGGALDTSQGWVFDQLIRCN